MTLDHLTKWFYLDFAVSDPHEGNFNPLMFISSVLLSSTWSVSIADVRWLATRVLKKKRWQITIRAVSLLLGLENRQIH